MSKNFEEPAALETARLPTPPTFDRLMINARWLLRLRWVAVVGQLTTIGAVAGWLQADLSMIPLLSIVAFTAGSNLAFATWLAIQQRRRQPGTSAEWDHLVIAAILAIDLVSLTGLLYFCGGPSNPFAVFYFVNLSLAAVILPTRWSGGLAALAMAGFAALLVRHVPLPALERTLSPDSLFPTRTYQQVGLGVALGACALVVIYFITRVTRELRQREIQLREAEQRRARSERLEALATLAAGAGHELASPLSTIAVIATDLAKHLEGTNAPASVLEDVSLIRSELDQCRRILDGMASSAGQASGEIMQPVAISALVREVVDAIRRREQVQVKIAADVQNCHVFVPLTATAQALRGIVRNALDVSSFGEPVELLSSRDDHTVKIIVRDRGPGMTDDVLKRAGDPFFTTKEPGKGMGLGLFLARNVIERIGGNMLIHSLPGKGTTVSIELPLREA
jgi:two-component system sensor histidine kinase RegB